MKNKFKIFRILFVASALVFGILKLLGLFDDPSQKCEYTLTGNIDESFVNTYPQQIIKSEDNKYYIIHYGTIENIMDVPETAETKEIINLYLQPSKYIQSDDDKFIELSKDLFSESDTDIIKIKKALEYTSTTIEFDKELAEKIADGSYGRDALSVLETRKGTCSEYANVFIALMRNQGIPARMAVGKIYRKSYHAWAEVYIDSRWVAVDPQANMFGVSNKHIKLYHGLDYFDIGVPLMDIDVTVKKTI